MSKYNSNRGIYGGVAQGFITVFTVLFLAIGLIGSGLFVCCAPFTTESLSTMFSRWDGSAFTQEELVKAAEVTRDYTVGSHDRNAVYHMLYEINRSSQEAGRSSAPLAGAPDLFLDSPEPNADVLAQNFRSASEMYVLSGEALDHLDDVFYVVDTARIALISLLIFGIVGCIILGKTAGRTRLGHTLVAAALFVIAIFAVLAVWVIVDFNGFFAVLHSLFFAEGSWTFDLDSLLIRMYPTNFWIGMGVVWLATTVLACLICSILGLLINGKKKA